MPKYPVMTFTADHGQPAGGAGSAEAARPVALVTGAGRTAGIAAGIVGQLAASGWDIAFTYWHAYDDRMPWGQQADATAAITEIITAQGAGAVAIEAVRARTDGAAPRIDANEQGLGHVTALVLCHCESVDSGLLDTSIESFDRHFAVNARASWLLIREYGLRFRGLPGSGRIIALTSDALAGNVPYGSSKGALDRITLAAASELAHLGISANAINPGPVDTGWMSADVRASCVSRTPLGRLGTPQDTAQLVDFLCSPRGGWINGQLLYSNGGFS
jgi:3-oxoacyl-[acyl-carrier protein] reductase